MILSNNNFGKEITAITTQYLNQELILEIDSSEPLDILNKNDELDLTHC